QKEVDMRLGEIRAGDDTVNLEIVAVNVFLRDFTGKAGIHHYSFQVNEPLLQVIAFELLFLASLDQCTGRQQQADGALLTIDNIPSAAILVKHNGSQTVGRLVLMNGNIGEQLVDVL